MATSAHYRAQAQMGGGGKMNMSDAGFVDGLKVECAQENFKRCYSAKEVLRLCAIIEELEKETQTLRTALQWSAAACRGKEAQLQALGAEVAELRKLKPPPNMDF